jgi:hypothetical protein
MRLRMPAIPDHVCHGWLVHQRAPPRSVAGRPTLAEVPESVDKISVALETNRVSADSWAHIPLKTRRIIPLTLEIEWSQGHESRRSRRQGAGGRT